MEHITKEETAIVEKLHKAWKEYIQAADKENDEKQKEIAKKYGKPENGWKERPPMKYYEECNAATEEVREKYPYADLAMDAENYPALWSFLQYCGVLKERAY